MARRRKNLIFLDFWPIYLTLAGLIGLGLYVALDSIRPRSDEWCRGLRKGYYAGSVDRRQYLSLEPSVEVGYQRSHLKAADRFYTDHKAYVNGYYRGYRQGYLYHAEAKVKHLEDTSRCDPNYMYLGWKRGYRY
jgi:hypothetical protein